MGLSKNSDLPDEVRPQSHKRNGGFVQLGIAISQSLIELQQCLEKYTKKYSSGLPILQTYSKKQG